MSKGLPGRFLLAILGLLITGSFLTPVYSQDDDLTAELDTFLNNLADQSLFSGSVLVVKSGEILLNKGYGMANREWDIPNAPDTKYRIGSISKQFTAMAILLLQERGSLTVQDSICQYIEDCPDTWADITIEQLLQHTSGIPDKLPDTTKPITPENNIRLVIDEPLNFTPGESWSYSNSGYIILGYIIKEVAGVSYERFLQDNLFTPLGMANSGYDVNDSILKHRATGYIQHGDRAAPYFHMTIPYAAGALYSTTEDLYLWVRALFSGQVVSQSSLDEMFGRGVLVQGPGSPTYYYGLFGTEPDGHRIIGHGGSVPGFQSNMAYFPDDDVTIIMLSNYDDANADMIATVMAGKLFSGG